MISTYVHKEVLVDIGYERNLSGNLYEKVVDHLNFKI